MTNLVCRIFPVSTRLECNPLLTLLTMGDFISEQSCTVVEGTHYTYRINTEGDACIESCKSACQSVRIPEALGGHPVAAIGDSAFSMLSCIETVVCPCALRHIGRHAFEGCLKLKNVSLNFGLQSIGEEAFFLCASLAGLDVPASVERFGPRPLGSSRSIQLRTSPSFEIRFDPARQYVHRDARKPRSHNPYGPEDHALSATWVSIQGLVNLAPEPQ